MFIKPEERIAVEPTREQKPLDEASQQLLRAAALIEQDGWWDGRYGGGGHCAWTAIVYAAGGVSNAWNAGERFARAIGGDSIVSIYPWNDSRDSATVIAKLRSVALGG